MTTLPLRLLLLLIFLLSYSSPTRAFSNRTKEAYVSLIYGDTYTLAVRVSMFSLLQNSPDVADGLRDRVVIVTGHTSKAAKRQLLHDGIRVITVPEMRSPYSRDAKFRDRFDLVMTKLYIFNMTQYHRIVFMDADTLVVGDLSPLFSCGQFCATYINPCHFNVGLMLITPNTSLFLDMIHQLPNLPSYDGGDQGFLNSYFPQLLHAPLYQSEAPPLSPPPFARLPFSWHVDHSAFFSSFDFAFSHSDRCGQPRLIEWLGPPVGKPWLWWTYGLLDLSWRWHYYRRQLHDPFPPGATQRTSAVLLIIISYIVMFMLARISHAIPPSSVLTSTLPRLTAVSMPKRLALSISIALGVCVWLLGFALAVAFVPQILPPLPAIVVFFHLRVVFTTLIMLYIGAAFGLRQTLSTHDRTWAPAAGKRVRLIFKEMVLWAVVDALYLIVWSGLIWKMPFEGMSSKLCFIGVLAISQIALVGLIMGRVSLLWMHLGNMFEEDGACTSQTLPDVRNPS